MDSKRFESAPSLNRRMSGLICHVFSDRVPRARIQPKQQAFDHVRPNGVQSERALARSPGCNGQIVKKFATIGRDHKRNRSLVRIERQVRRCSTCHRDPTTHSVLLFATLVATRSLIKTSCRIQDTNKRDERPDLYEQKNRDHERIGAYHWRHLASYEQNTRLHIKTNKQQFG